MENNKNPKLTKEQIIDELVVQMRNDFEKRIRQGRRGDIEICFTIGDGYKSNGDYSLKVVKVPVAEIENPFYGFGDDIYLQIELTDDEAKYHKEKELKSDDDESESE